MEPRKRHNETMVKKIFHFIAIAITPLSLLTSSGQAAEGPSMKEGAEMPLLFQVEKNNIQILPQRFEYNIQDEDHLKIGDIEIDSTTFGFQIAPGAEQPKKYRARFVWPSSLLRNGTLTIKNNIGKAVWSANVSKKNTKLITPNKKNGENSSRTLLTEFITDQIDANLIEDMKYFPFMSFCINRVSQDTSIYLCSKELFLSAQDGKVTIRARSQGKRESFVEINGKSVGPQGIIFLNDENENIGFRAMTPSGAILEVETRLKPVDFKDVVLSEDQKFLMLTATGAEPVDEEKVKRVSDETWQFPVEVERPILYLKGAGDIPMRQEFYIKGEVPADKLRPHLKAGSYARVYGSQLPLSVVAANQTTLGAGAGTQKLEPLNKSLYRWTLNDIPAGQFSRHYLRVNNDAKTFIAGYDVYRDYAVETSLLGDFTLTSSQASGSVRVNWWIENFFGSDDPWARLQWGLQFNQSVLFNKKDNQANLNITHLELIWRALPGFHFVDPTWGLSLPFEILKNEDATVTSLGLGIFYSDKPPKALKNWMSWYDTKFIYLLGGGSDIKLKSGFQLSGLAYLPYDKQLSWNYGLGLNTYAFDPGKAYTELHILGGLTYRF